MIDELADDQRVAKRKGKQTKRSTIADVAALAKVSVKTVSRVVRREPNVKPDKIATVEAAIKILRYRPMMSARSSTGTRSFVIGLLSYNPYPSHTFVFDLLLGARAATRAQGYQLSFEPLEGGAHRFVEESSEIANQGNLDGVIMPPPLSEHADVIDALCAYNIPVARITPHSSDPRCYDVGIDDASAIGELVDHLVALGHRRIAFIKGRAGIATSDRRLTGFEMAMARNGIELVPAWIRQGDFTHQGGFDQALSLLVGDDRPTAVVASNDDMALGVLNAAAALGISVPHDLSVTGFDDSPTAMYASPTLTTIRQPAREFAAVSANRIIGHWRKPADSAPGWMVLPHSMIVRDSTGPAPADRENQQAALNLPQS